MTIAIDQLLRRLEPVSGVDRAPENDRVETLDRRNLIGCEHDGLKPGVTERMSDRLRDLGCRSVFRGCADEDPHGR